MKTKLVAFVFLLFCLSSWAQNTQTSEKIRLKTSSSGKIESLEIKYKGNWKNISFRTDSMAGPSWFVTCEKNKNYIDLHSKDNTNKYFEGQAENLQFKLKYEIKNDLLAITASIKNIGDKAFQPTTAGLQLGINAYTVNFPQWIDKFSPTLLRCEKTHFWGYFQTPEGTILSISSPDPVASWNMVFNRHAGHRILTADLGLLNQLPLPDRHPQNLAVLQPGESKQWTIYLKPIEKQANLKSTLSDLIDAPMIDATGHHTVSPGQSIPVTIYGRNIKNVNIKTPDGKIIQLKGKKKGTSASYVFTPDETPGVYQLQASNTFGKQSEALFYVRKPWSWYLEKARLAIIAMPPVAAPYCEWWYNGYTTFIAQRRIPDPGLDKITEDDFRRIVLNNVYDTATGKPKQTHPPQKNGAMIGILVDAYLAKGNIADLEIAARIADYQVDVNQRESDGAYVAHRDGLHYTAVIYPAKSILELCEVEKELGKKDPIWQKRYEKHYASAKRAIDNLALKLDDIQTEGETSFEDGMISCSALQLGYFALLQDDETSRKKYADACRAMLMKHRCLEQLELPDCRIIGGTMRFWEGYHDLRLTPNVLNSPHGWGSWKTYATYYMYLLSGEEQWLKETMDAVGSAMQMVDLKTEKLRWGFAPDPFVIANVQRLDSTSSTGMTPEVKIIGEQYIPMNHYWRKESSSDNDVHEHFKMMEEVALTHAYVLERPDGSLLCYNCKVSPSGNSWTIIPDEALVESVHLNLSQAKKITIRFFQKEVTQSLHPGMTWMNKGESKVVK